MAPNDLRSLLATFADTFQHVRLFGGGDVSDVILVGSDEPLELRGSMIDEMLQNNPLAAANLESIGISQAEDIVKICLMDRDGILRIAGDAGLNTDDNMRIEFAAPLHLHDQTLPANVRLLRRGLKWRVASSE